jgi:hypothetical protein
MENPKMMLNHSKILDEGNCGRATDRGKEAGVKLVSLRTETTYKASHPGKLAQHSKAQDSGCGGKRRGCIRKVHDLTRGDLGHMRSAEMPAAPPAAMRAVMIEKSAEAVVVGGNEPGAKSGPFKR